jgi:hypothetical protein
MSLTRRLTTWHGGSHWSAGPVRPPAGATGLPCRRLVAPYHTPDHATCLSRRPAAPPRYPHKAPVCHATRASMALYAQATRLSCYACERTGALVALPDAPLTRSCMLSCLLAVSDQGWSPVGRGPPYARPNPTKPHR